MLRVGGLTESISVIGERRPSTCRAPPGRWPHDVQTAKQAAAAPSQNIINLQQRTTGVLPVRIDVPRAGTSHQFIKPLVVDQETTVKLRYKRR